MKSKLQIENLALKNETLQRKLGSLKEGINQSVWYAIETLLNAKDDLKAYTESPIPIEDDHRAFKIDRIEDRIYLTTYFLEPLTSYIIKSNDFKEDVIAQVKEHFWK